MKEKRVAVYWRDSREGFIINVMESVLKREQITFSECTTWTTDGFFRETEDMVAYRKREGCDVVEMECAALAACARKRGVQFG